MTRERFQNPVVGSTIKLRLYSYNNSKKTNFSSVDNVKIYFLDPNAKTEINPDGRTLVKTINSNEITNDVDGEYYVEFELSQGDFFIGNYVDVWTVLFETTEDSSEIENIFKIWPDLWHTSTSPIVYDYNFSISPTKIVKGTKRYLIINITPNVADVSELKKYYESLAVVSPVKISIKQRCGDCLPEEDDLRVVVDEETIEIREQTQGYYFIDTSEMNIGIYDVWFTMDVGDSHYITDKQNIQIIE